MSLADVCRAHGVPGATLGVLRGGDVTVEAHGVTSRATGVEVTPETVFQWGSITKVWTAVLVQELVDEGALDLDVPVRTWLPDLRVADPEVTERVTLRHLLSHTSGIAGDHFHDTGRGDDCLARYVESCAGLGQDVPFGSTMSYCNTGFSIVGRVLEVVSGRSWDRLLRKRLVRPLGLATTGTLPEEAILHRAAVGHLGLPGQEQVPVPVWQLARSGGPAGILHGSAADLLAFARLHLDGRWAALRAPQVEVPDPWALGSHWGLGWSLYTGRSPGYGHNGSTLGQYAYLRVVPERDLAVCLLTNGGSAGSAWRALLGELVDLDPAPAPPAEPPALDLARYEGRYERLAVTADVRLVDGALAVSLEAHGVLAAARPPEARVVELRLTPVDEAVFLAEGPALAAPAPLVFFDADDDGRPRRFHHGLRAHSRAAA